MGKWGVRLLQREACLTDPGSLFLEKEGCLDENKPKDVTGLQMVLETLHSKSTKNMEFFKKP